MLCRCRNAIIPRSPLRQHLKRLIGLHRPFRPPLGSIEVSGRDDENDIMKPRDFIEPGCERRVAVAGASVWGAKAEVEDPRSCLGLCVHDKLLQLVEKLIRRAVVLPEQRFPW